MKLPVKNFYVKSSLFTIFSLLAAVCNYALYPILVRVLPVSDFGDFAVASATLNQTLAVLLTINIISIYLVKRYGEGDARTHAKAVQKALLWFFGVLCAIILLLWPFLQSIFKVEHSFILIPLILVLTLNIPLVVWNGYLQGNKELVRIGIGTFSSSFAKLVFAAMLGLLAGAVGAMFGILVGTLAGLIVLQLYPGVKTPGLETVLKKMSRAELNSLLKLRFYIIQVALVVGAFGILQSYDISLAKILFDPQIAGTYSGISILSTALYYLAFILVWIILPEISIDNRKINRRVLTTAYRLYFALAVVAVIFIILFGDTALPAVLGSAYSGKTDLLLFGALYQMTLVATVLYAYSLLVRQKKRAVLLAGLVFGLCTSLPALLGSANPATMIRTLWLSIILAVGIYSLMVTFHRLLRRSEGSL